MPKNDELVEVKKYVSSVKEELTFATENNFLNEKVYDFTKAYLRYGTVKKLKNVEAELKKSGYGIIILDAFRPLSAQAKLCLLSPDAMSAMHPVSGDPVYSRGNTVAVTLYDLKTGQAVEMPDKDNANITAEATANAQRLEQTMKKHGFNACASEWWRFTDSTSYPVDEYFDPVISASTWYANCNNYISLRKKPSSSSSLLTTIPKNATMEVLGWENNYAKVRYKNTVGYVAINYILPSSNGYFLECLNTVPYTNVYTYERMQQDMQSLKLRFPDDVTVASIGTSELGRDIALLRIGKEDAQYHVLLQGAMHAREHLTAWLLMAMAESWLQNGILGYGDVCYHIIPMVNPDGVTISQTQTLNDVQKQIYASDRENGRGSSDKEYYASRWKANGLGVDINRNFSSGWEAIDERDDPSSEGYKGTAPFSTAEAAALRDYTLKYDFDATVSYHATGSIIYCEYGDRKDVNAQSRQLGEAVGAVTGYRTSGNPTDSAAGYKDWAIDELGIPSLTIEIGLNEAPLAKREIYNILARNYYVLPQLARWVQQN